MNVDYFYERMKDALNFLGVKWGDKDQVTIKFEGDFVIFSLGDDSVKFKVNE
jgi:hypothetical protein